MMNIDFLQWAIRNEVQLHFGETAVDLLNPVPFIRLESPRRTVIYPLPRDAELMEEILPWIIYRARAELGDIERTQLHFTDRDTVSLSNGEPALTAIR